MRRGGRPGCRRPRSGSRVPTFETSAEDQTSAKFREPSGRSEERAIRLRLRPASVLGVGDDAREQPGEDEAVEGCHDPASRGGPSRPRGRNSAVWTMRDPAASRGASSQVSQASPGRRISACRRSRPAATSLDPPEVDRVSRRRGSRVSPSPAQARAPDQLVEHAADLPEQLAGVPALVAADRRARAGRPRRDALSSLPCARR